MIWIFPMENAKGILQATLNDNWNPYKEIKHILKGTTQVNTKDNINVFFNSYF